MGSPRSKGSREHGSRTLTGTSFRSASSSDPRHRRVAGAFARKGPLSQTSRTSVGSLAVLLLIHPGGSGQPPGTPGRPAVDDGFASITVLLGEGISATPRFRSEAETHTEAWSPVVRWSSRFRLVT